MAYFYVKNGGTATGDAGRYATQQTGSFSALGTANYYPTLSDALLATTPPTSGDYICVSDIATDSQPASNETFSHSTSVVNPPLYLISVDDTAINTAKKATSAQIERLDLFFQRRWYIYGMHLTANDDGGMRSIANSSAFCIDCTFETTGISDISISVNATDGMSMYLQDCSIVCGHPNGDPMTVSNGGLIDLSNCVFSGSEGWLMNTGFGQGGGTVRAYGCDFSAITGTLIRNIGGDPGADDRVDVTIAGCKLNSAVAYTNEVFSNPHQRLTIVRSGHDSACAYQYFVTALGGVAEDWTPIYRDASIALAGQKISLKVTTDTNTSLGGAFWFELPSQYVDLSSASSDVMTIHLLSSDATLTNKDVWISLLYPDGTNAFQTNRLTTGIDVFATGTALTTTTETWTGRTTETRYKIDLDTSIDVGGAGVPRVRVFVTKPSTVIYFCPTVDVS